MNSYNKIRFSFIIVMAVVFATDYVYGIHWLFYLIPLLLFISYIIASSSILSLNSFIKTYTHPNTTDKKLVITFDDGPSANTLKVLEVLEKFNTKATFFCIGQKIEEHPDVIKQIVLQGHTIGNHSYSHSYWFPFFRINRITAEITKTNELLEQHTGKQNKLFRPPFGVMNPRIATAVRATQQLVMGWSLRSFDTSTNNVDKVVKRIKNRLQAGTVLLLHDDRNNTPEILAEVLQYAQANDYKITDLQEIFKLTS